MTASVQKFLKRGFHTWLPHPPLVVWFDMYENHILYLLPYSYNVTVYKDQNQNLVCYWICEGAKLSFSFKAKFFFVCYHGNKQ